MSIVIPFLKSDVDSIDRAPAPPPPLVFLGAAAAGVHLATVWCCCCTKDPLLNVAQVREHGRRDAHSRVQNRGMFSGMGRILPVAFSNALPSAGGLVGVRPVLPPKRHRETAPRNGTEVDLPGASTQVAHNLELHGPNVSDTNLCTACWRRQPEEKLSNYRLRRGVTLSLALYLLVHCIRWPFRKKDTFLRVQLQERQPQQIAFYVERHHQRARSCAYINSSSARGSWAIGHASVGCVYRVSRRRYICTCRRDAEGKTKAWTPNRPNPVKTSKNSTPKCHGTHM